MKCLLPKLTDALEASMSEMKPLTVTRSMRSKLEEDNEIISHAWLWPRVSQFFRPKDVIVGETGTSAIGLLDTPVCNTESLSFHVHQVRVAVP
jgi:pyruvate decarboxylase